MLACFLSVLACISASGGRPPLLQPATYVSPLGEFELFVDPTHRLGRGAGRYRMSHAGETVWSSVLPFTLWEAAVDDSGRCVGYALVDDPSNKSAGELVIAMFAPDGIERLEQRVRREWAGFNGPPNPTPSGVFLQPELDRFVLRMRVYDCMSPNEEWWPYELSTGRALERVRPAAAFAGTETIKWSLLARAVAGTPLTLVHWKRDDYTTKKWGGSHGARFALHDAAWKAVWTLDLVDDYAPIDGSESSTLPELQSTGALMPAVRAPRQFDIVRYADKQVVTYEVESASDGSSTWNVRELARRPFTADDLPDVPALDLRPLGVAALAREGGPTGEFHDRDYVFIDALGRVAIVDGTTRALRVFDSKGKQLFVWTPASDAAGVPRWPSDLDVDADGNFRVQVSRSGDDFVIIDPSSARGSSRAIGVSRFALRPGSRELWGRFHQGFEEAEELRRVTFDGEVVTTVARRPDGQWFREIDAVGVAADGSVAVLDEPRLQSGDSDERVLAVYAADGATERIVQLPRYREIVAASQRHLAVGSRWIVLQTLGPGACLVSRLDGSLRRFEEPVVVENDQWTAALSPDEKELWVAHTTPPTLRRYALPEN